MTFKDIWKFKLENHYKRIDFTKKDSYYLLKKGEKKKSVLFATNLIKKIPDSTKANKIL